MLSASIAIAEKLGDLAGVPFWYIPLAVIAFSLVVGSLAVLPMVPRILLSWILMVTFSLWLILTAIQLLFGDPLYPRVQTGSCLLKLSFDQICARPRYEESVAVDATAPPVTQPSRNPTPPPVERSKARIYLQFSVFQRSIPQGIAAKLSSLGWQIEGAENGGERTSNADGTHDVRYFHQDDAALAEALAVDLAGLVPGTPEILVKDLSSIRAKVPVGQLEIWISKLPQ